MTSLMVILLILDMKHPFNYFINEFESQNIKNIVYHEEDELIGEKTKTKLQAKGGYNLDDL